MVQTHPNVLLRVFSMAAIVGGVEMSGAEGVAVECKRSCVGRAYLLFSYGFLNAGTDAHNVAASLMERGVGEPDNRHSGKSGRN
jgi:hypothetical protein